MLSNADRRGNGRSFAAPTSRRDRWTCATGAALTRAVQNARASDFRGSGRPFAGRTGPRGWWMSSAASAAIPGAARPAGTGPAGCAPSFAVSEGCCDLQRATFGLCVSSKSVVWVRSRIHAQKFAAVRTGEPRKLRWVPCLPRPFFACGQYRCARALGVCELARFSDARRSVVNASARPKYFQGGDSTLTRERRFIESHNFRCCGTCSPRSPLVAIPDWLLACSPGSAHRQAQVGRVGRRVFAPAGRICRRFCFCRRLPRG